MFDFNYILFTNPSAYEECLLRDRKSMIRYWRDEEKAEFIRDTIALANTARMLGKPAYLLLGIRDKTTEASDDICGIGEMYERLIVRGQTQNQAFETMKRELAHIIRKFITPLLSPEIRFGKVNEKIVGYILIKPHVKGPFAVKQEFRVGGITHLQINQCWLRFGESKDEIEIKELGTEDDQFSYCYAEIPYVLPSVWHVYFEQLRDNISDRWQKFDPPKESAYQDLYDEEGNTIQKDVNMFLNTSEGQLLILQGSAGCGKSLFLQRLANSLAEDGIQEMKAAQQSEQFHPPSGWIPVQYPLRILCNSAKKSTERFVNTLCNLLSKLWVNGENNTRPKHPEKLFEKHDLHWLFLLDGLDEVGDCNKRREFLQVLLEFMAAYPRIRIILTTRPVINLGDIGSTQIDIASLNESQIENFLLAYRQDKNDEEIHAFIEQCKMYPDFWRLISIPVFLNAAATVVDIPATTIDTENTQAENSVLMDDILTYENTTLIASESNIFTNHKSASLEVDNPISEDLPQRLENNDQLVFSVSLPYLLDRVYSHYWDREEKRRIIEGLQEIKHGTYKIAAISMNRYAARMEYEHAKRVLKTKGLAWTLEMGILAENEYAHIYFYVPSAQVYSAAKKLQGDVEGGFWDSIQRYVRRWDTTYRKEIESYFEDLTGRSFQSILNSIGGSNG